jgi:hypothetical protein
VLRNICPGSATDYCERPTVDFTMNLTGAGFQGVGEFANSVVNR